LIALVAAFWVIEPLMLLVALSLLAVHGLQAGAPRWFTAIFGIGLLLLWPPGMWTDGSASYDAAAVTLVSQGLDLFQVAHVPLQREIRWGEGEYPIHRYLVLGDGLGVVLACSIFISWLFQRSLLHTALLTLSAILLGWFAEVATDDPIFLAYGSEPTAMQIEQASWIACVAAAGCGSTSEGTFGTDRCPATGRSTTPCGLGTKSLDPMAEGGRQCLPRTFSGG
jgi:hypothetical protein